MSSNSTSLVRYIRRRWEKDNSIRPQVVHTDFTTLYGSEFATSVQNVRKWLKRFNDGDFSKEDKGPFFPSVEAKDNQLPETTSSKSQTPAAEDQQPENTAPLTTLIEPVADDVDNSSDSDSSEESEESGDEVEGTVDMEQETSFAVIEPGHVAASLSPVMKRSFILHHFLQRHSQEESIRSLQETFGADQYSSYMVKFWWSRFDTGDFSCEDKQGGGNPKAVSDQDLLASVEVVPSPTPKEIAVQHGVSSKTVIRRLKALGYSLKLDRWIPHELNQINKTKRIEFCAALLDKLERDPEFLNRTITTDEKWVYHDTPKRRLTFSKKGERSSMGVPRKGFHVTKTMVTVFWDHLGVVHHEYMPRGQTITASSYCEVLDRVQDAIRAKRPWLLEGGCRVILQQDNARPHTAKLTKEKINQLGWELLPHPPYSPDLAPSDYHLFLAMSNSQMGTKFADDDAAKRHVENFFQLKDIDGVGEANFYHRGIWKLPFRWQQCIAANGEYFDVSKKTTS